MYFTKILNTLFLALAPIFFIYLLSNEFPLVFVLIPLLALLNLLTINLFQVFRQRRNEIQWYISIFIIGLVGMLFNYNQTYFSLSSFFNNFIGLSLFFMALILFTANVNIKLFKKTLLFVGILAAIICLFQRVQLLLTGTFYKEFFLPGLIVKRDLDTFTTTRVSAFFTEPAHLSIYLLPIYYIALREKKVIISIILGLGILFSGSSTGIIILSVLTVYFIVKIVKKNIYIIPILIGIIGLYIGIMVLFPDVLLSNLEKLNSTDSGSIRLLGPLQYLTQFDIFQYFFGVGLNQLADFLSSKGIHLITNWGKEVNANYANAAIYMILSYGLTGFIFFIRYLYETVKIQKSDWGFILFSLGILLSDQVLFNMNLLYLLAFLILSKQILNYNLK